MTTHTIQEFTPKRLEDVKKHWKGLAGADEFAVELEGVLDWCATHIHPAHGDSQAYDLCNNESGECDAIVEIVDGRRGQLTKLLKLVLGPQYWRGPEDYADIVNLYHSAFVGVIVKGLIKGAKDVKIYGRDDLMLSILRSIHAHWDSDGAQATASLGGRWLTISLSE